MFPKLYQRLLTHYPLLWNTRVAWVAGFSFIIHLFFFVAGFLTVSPSSLKEYYGLSSMISASLYTFAILSSLAILILWLVFYLRNNAFKNFYIIGKYHSAKECCIIFIIILFAISFPESYRWGALVKAGTITGREQLVKEANIINLAKTFIPQSKADYFKLNNCDDNAMPVDYNEGFNYYDTSHYAYHDTNNIKIRAALNEPGAFSYKNYCRNFIDLHGYKNFIPVSQWMTTRNRWIDNHNADSIKYILDECLLICKKYDIYQNINTFSLSRLVFADSFYNVTRIIAGSYYLPDNNDKTTTHFYATQLMNALEFIDESHLNSRSSENFIEAYTFEAYTALCLSILLLCYRLYSRKVFLISVIGTLVWSIVFALFGVSSGGNGIAWFYLFLFLLFLLLAGLSLNSKNNKTATGVLLNWHIYMIPFVIMIIVLLINENYYDNFGHLHPYNNDAEMKKLYPFGYWVNNNTGLISRLNLLFVFLYTAFFFTRLSKKWHIMPEE